MSWFQKEFSYATSRGKRNYLITSKVLEEVPEIRDYKVGVLHLFVRHTSCGLSLNENFDPDVRFDLDDALDRLVPEDGADGEQLYRHTDEGADDMPAHVKSSLVGAAVSIPIRDGALLTGQWQGIWLLEFRRDPHRRSLVATIQGQKN